MKRYVTECGSRVVSRLLRSHRVISSVLLGIETRSALRRRRDERAITRKAYERLLRLIDADEKGGSLVPVSDDVLLIARLPVLSHPVRTLDAILPLAPGGQRFAPAARIPFQSQEPPFVAKAAAGDNVIVVFAAPDATGTSATVRTTPT